MSTPDGFTPYARSSRYLDLIGPLYEAVDDPAVVGLRIEGRHTNARGFLHAGVLVAVADVLMGHTAHRASPPGTGLVTASLTTDFPGSAQPGDWVTGAATVRRIGRKARLHQLRVHLERPTGPHRQRRLRHHRPKGPSTMTTTDRGFRQDIADATLSLPVAAAFGLTFTELAAGRAEGELAWRPELSHTPGAFQANPIAALADLTGVAAGITLLPPGSAAATVDYTVKFLAEARGDQLVARARVLRLGKTLTVAAVDIFVVRDRTETLCATALVTMRNITNGARSVTAA